MRFSEAMLFEIENPLTIVNAGIAAITANAYLNIYFPYELCGKRIFSSSVAERTGGTVEPKGSP